MPTRSFQLPISPDRCLALAKAIDLEFYDTAENLGTLDIGPVPEDASRALKIVLNGDQRKNNEAELFIDSTNGINKQNIALLAVGAVKNLDTRLTNLDGIVSNLSGNADNYATTIDLEAGLADKASAANTMAHINATNTEVAELRNATAHSLANKAEKGELPQRIVKRWDARQTPANRWLRICKLGYMSKAKLTLFWQNNACASITEIEVRRVTQHVTLSLSSTAHGDSITDVRIVRNGNEYNSSEYYVEIKASSSVSLDYSDCFFELHDAIGVTLLAEYGHVCNYENNSNDGYFFTYLSKALNVSSLFCMREAKFISIGENVTVFYYNSARQNLFPANASANMQRLTAGIAGEDEPYLAHLDVGLASTFKNSFVL